MIAFATSGGTEIHLGPWTKYNGSDYLDVSLQVVKGKEFLNYAVIAMPRFG